MALLSHVCDVFMHMKHYLMQQNGLKIAARGGSSSGSESRPFPGTGSCDLRLVVHWLRQPPERQEGSQAALGLVHHILYSQSCWRLSCPFSWACGRCCHRAGVQTAVGTGAGHGAAQGFCFDQGPLRGSLVGERGECAMGSLSSCHGSATPRPNFVLLNIKAKLEKGRTQ